jgi:hypothetical protein
LTFFNFVLKKLLENAIVKGWINFEFSRIRLTASAKKLLFIIANTTRSLKVQKIEVKRDFHVFLRQNTVFSKALAIFFVSYVHNSYSHQKSQVVKYNIIQMLNQNLVEVGGV